jgi:hypothetical protein
MKTKFQTENVGTSQVISTFFILTRPEPSTYTPSRGEATS